MGRIQKEKFTGVGSLTWLRILFCGITLLITIIILISLSFPTSLDDGIQNDSNYRDFNTKLPTFKEGQLDIHAGGNLSNTKTTLNSSRKLVLDTPTCKIGQGNLWPPEFKDNWNWSSGKNRVPNCDHEQKLFSYVKPNEMIKVIYPNFKECSVREIVSEPGAPNNNYVSEVNQINLTTSPLVNVAHMEMFIVVCNKFVNFEANLLSKPHVEKKTWFSSNKIKNDRETTNQNKPSEPSKGKNEENKPINILWLGIDTTSNIHFHRSFPKTLKVLNEMNFMEFSGYHSIMFMTQPNFLAFLMGSTYKMTQTNECNTNSSTTWDTCPFIWKEFQKRNYVTMFLEDFEGTLNRNSKLGGFKRAPTDYYLQPLFLYHKQYRENVAETDKDCMSTETVPQFLLRYNERFLQKFNSTTPFFAFTWFNYPFHSFDFALPNADVDFEKFYRKLQADPKLLENTLIILNADHGQRYGIYTRNSIEGFLERSLPPLFIRIPEKLLEQYPNFRLQEFAETNRHRLTTPFDIHHTLLHVLSLGDRLMGSPILPAKIKNSSNSQNSSSQHTQEFQTVLADRSSLFSMIPNNRTCDTVHIVETICVCNTHLASKHLTNPFEVSRMIDYAMKQINAVIIGSKSEGLCKTWEGTWLPLSSADVIHKSGNSTVVLLKWDTVPVAQFETQLRITLENSSEAFNRIETVTEPVRISSYGNSTWCIPGGTNRDRHIKEFCYCK